MSTGQGRSETPEPPRMKKFVVGLCCGAAHHDVAFVGHGAIVRLFDFDARVCALARLFFPDKNVVRPFDIRAESVGALVAGVESAVPGFNSRRGGATARGGGVVKIMARSIRVTFCGCRGSETYDAKTERVLTVAP